MIVSTSMIFLFNIRIVFTSFCFVSKIGVGKIFRKTMVEEKKIKSIVPLKIYPTADLMSKVLHICCFFLFFLLYFDL